MISKLFCLNVCLIFSFYLCFAWDLEFKTEDEVLQLIRDEKFIIALLGRSEDCTDTCSLLENSLSSVREELVEVTGAWVIRSHSPKLNKELGLPDSMVVFYRNGIPILYTGKADSEEYLLSYLSQNKESLVITLNDDNFEASSGATTGDWLIMFMRTDCENCGLKRPILEATAFNLKGKKNVAVINKDLNGGVTTRRFEISSYPSVILLHQGQVFYYNLEAMDVSALTHFAVEGYNEFTPFLVPEENSPINDLLKSSFDWLLENPVQVLSIFTGISFFIVVVYLLNRPPPESWVKKKKRK